MVACHERPGNRAVAMIGAYVAIDAQETHQLPALSRVALLEVFGTLDAQRHYQQQCQQPRATSGRSEIKGQFLPSLSAQKTKHPSRLRRTSPRRYVTSKLTPNDDMLPYMRHRVSYMAEPPKLSESHAGMTAGPPPKRKPGRKPPDEQHSHSDEVSVMNKLVLTIFLAEAAALVVACGGGMSSATNPTGNAPVMATGTITGFGSIYVNGVHFKTTSATIRKNGQVVAQSALKVGENVAGPIATIDTTNNMLTVLGQTVKIDGGTSLSSDVQPADITGLKVADFVEVSGLAAAD